MQVGGRVTAETAAHWLQGSNLLVGHKESVAFKVEPYSGPDTKMDAGNESGESQGQDSQHSGSGAAADTRTLRARLANTPLHTHEITKGILARAWEP